MSGLSKFEVFELMSIFEASIDLQIQLWITLTFAAVAGSYLGREHLSTRFCHFLVSVYLLATLVTIGRWSFEAYRLVRLVEEYPFLANSFPPWAMFFAPTVWLLLGIGTAGCVYSVYYFRRLTLNSND